MRLSDFDNLFYTSGKGSKKSNAIFQLNQKKGLNRMGRGDRDTDRRVPPDQRDNYRPEGSPGPKGQLHRESNGVPSNGGAKSMDEHVHHPTK